MKIMFFCFGIFWLVQSLGLFTPQTNDFTQNPHSTLEQGPLPAEYLLEQARNFFQESRLDSALIYYEAAAQLFKKTRDWDEFVECCVQISYIRVLAGESERPWHDLKKVQELVVAAKGEEYPALAKIYHGLGFLLFRKGKYSEARAFYKKALAFSHRPFDEANSMLARIYMDLGELFTIQAEFDSAEQCYREALPLSRLHSGDSSRIVAMVYYNRGNLLRMKGKYREALGACHHALAKLTVKNDEPLVELASCYDNLGKIHLALGDFKTSRSYFERAQSIKKNIFTESSVPISQSLAYLGQVDVGFGDYDDALAKYFKAAVMYEKFYDAYHPFLAGLYNDIATTLHKKGDISAPVEYYRKALAINLEVFGENHIFVAMNYTNLGLLKYHLDEADEALRYYYQARDIFLRKLGGDSPLLVTLFCNIGNVYKYNGDFEQAQMFYQKAYAITLKSLSETSQAFVLMNLGGVYAGKRNFTQALASYESALIKYKKAYGAEDISCATIYSQLGNLYRLMGKYEKAAACLNKSTRIFLGKWGAQDHRVMKNYDALGQVHLAAGNYNQAIKYQHKALRIGIQIFGEKQVTTAMFYRALGVTHFQQNRIDQALLFFQKALQAWVIDFNDSNVYHNPDLYNVSRLPRFLELLEFKADALMRRFNKSNGWNDLEAAFSTYQLASQTIDIMRNRFKLEESKLFLGDVAARIYPKAVAAAYQTYEVSRQELYKEQAFTFAEKSKAVVLLEALRKSKAKKFAGVADSLLERERRLSLHLALYRKNLAAEMDKGREADKSKILFWQERLSSLQNAFDQLKHKLEADYPAYYHLQYNVNTSSAKILQSQALASNTTLIEYIAHDSAIFIFTVNKSRFAIKRVVKDSLLERQIKKLRASLLHNNYKNYAMAAHWLYRQLVAPIAPQLSTKRLIIIPEGSLGYLPFETLLTTDQLRKDEDFRQLPYLIKNYQINYAYSATLWHDSMVANKSTPVGEYLGFAPIKFK